MSRRKGRQIDLAEALSALEKKLDRKGGGVSTQVKIAAAWEKIAGPAVCPHTTGAHLRDGELVIHVDSSAWATELTALSGPYREAIEQEMGGIPVRALRFTVSKKVDARHAISRAERKAEEFYKPDETVSVPLSQEETYLVRESAAVIKDSLLRETVIKATIADLEWKKGIEAAKVR